MEAPENKPSEPHSVMLTLKDDQKGENRDGSAKEGHPGFKVGDKVRVKSGDWQGDVCTIAEFREKNVWPWVAYRCSDGEAGMFYGAELEPIYDEPEQAEFKIGSKVRVKPMPHLAKRLQNREGFITFVIDEKNARFRVWFQDGTSINFTGDELEIVVEEQEANQPNPLTSQVGGEHYKTAAIQPVEFIHANGLNFLEGCVVKRICRHRRKNGKEDLEKAIHELQILIALEYGTEVAK